MDYMLPNCPVLLGSWLTAEWPATREWVVASAIDGDGSGDGDGDGGGGGEVPVASRQCTGRGENSKDRHFAINYAAIRQECGELIGPVTHCGVSDVEQLAQGLPNEMPVARFLDYMQQQQTQWQQQLLKHSGGQTQLEEPSNAGEQPRISGPSLPGDCRWAGPVYLKDFHYQARCPGRPVYSLPGLFASDWLNAYCRARRRTVDDDFRFVYLGPVGSFTPLHTDVLGSFSWSSNVCGRKECAFLPSPVVSAGPRSLPPLLRRYFCSF